MKCPYTGYECKRCEDVCELDNERYEKRRDPISERIVVDLSETEFTCECGATITSPVHPCGTKGCRFSL